MLKNLLIDHYVGRKFFPNAKPYFDHIWSVGNHTKCIILIHIYYLIKCRLNLHHTHNKSLKNKIKILFGFVPPTYYNNYGRNKNIC